MSGGGEPPPPPVAIVRTRDQRRRRISLIWAIPIVTLMVAGFLAWDTLSKRGPLIAIRFDTASGLQPKQSKIRLRDVELGVVESVALSPDRDGVIVSARMNREATPMLTSGARFWVVKPRFFAGSISGLETLVSGSYIQLEPSDDGGGAPATEFTGLEDPPVMHSSVRGHTYRITAKRLGSINAGSPVLFRDLMVGEVLGWTLGKKAEDVTIHAFVRAPYDAFVHEDTVFWNASGASINLGPAGLKLELESLRALLLGGIAFDTPDRAVEAPLAREDAPFDLHTDRDTAMSATFNRTIHFKSYFKGSTAGLIAGAPVTLHGLRIGAVSDIALHYDKDADEISVGVSYEVEPERVAELKMSMDDRLDAVIEHRVKHGLRIQMASTNLVTGAKQLVMDIVPHAPGAEYAKEGDRYIIPPLDGDRGDITASANALMTRLQDIPFEKIGDNLNKTLAGASGTLNDPKLRQAIAALTDTLASVQTLMTSLNKGAEPLLRRLPQIATELEDTVKHTNQLIGSLDNNQAGGSQFGRDTNRLMGQLSDAARSVRILADLLSRHPEALIRGRTDQDVR